jgi:hypothetical protein
LAAAECTKEKCITTVSNWLEGALH